MSPSENKDMRNNFIVKKKVTSVKTKILNG